MPTYGVLLRVYTPKAEEVPDRVKRATLHVRQIQEVAREFPRLKKTMLLVPRDHDCGKTAAALREAVEEFGTSVEVLDPPGYHSMEVLNEGVHALESHVSHAIIISGKALSYLTAKNLVTVDDAVSAGAKVAGLALPELAGIVRSGRIQNTFAVWDIEALTSVGGFDSKLDVEEVAPIIRLIRLYGPCVAPLECGGTGLDIHGSETAQARHEEVMRTKIEAQQHECERLEATFETIKAGVIIIW